MSSSGDAIGECNEIVNVLRQSVNGCSLARDVEKRIFIKAGCSCM